MKKRNLWTGAVAVAMLCGATTVGASVNAAGQNPGNSSSSFITIEQAKDAALKVEAGRVEEVELERKFGKIYYDVEIDQANGDVDVHIDAVTGEVMTVKDREQDDDDDDDDLDYSVGSNRTVTGETKINADQASAIAAKHVTGATVVKVQLDSDDGRYVYEVDLVTAQGEAEVEIDAVTGKVLSVDQDFDDWD